MAPNTDNGSQGLFNWLSQGSAYILNAQDGKSHTRVWSKRSAKVPDAKTMKCRVWGGKDELVDHILCGCLLYSWSLYMERNNKCFREIQFCLAKRLGLIKHMKGTWVLCPDHIQGGSYEFVWDRYWLYDRQSYYRDVKALDWSPVFECTNVQDVLDLFHRMLLTVIECHSPYKFMKFRNNNVKWVTNEFLGLLDERNYRLKHYKKHPSQLNKRLRQEALFNVRVMKCELQQEYFNILIHEAEGDSKETWRALTEFWPTKRKTYRTNSLEGITDDLKMAARMNNHFATAGANLSNGYPVCND